MESKWQGNAHIDIQCVAAEIDFIFAVQMLDPILRKPATSWFANFSHSSRHFSLNSRVVTRFSLTYSKKNVNLYDLCRENV
jgi:hypothetical protein